MRIILPRLNGSDGLPLRVLGSDGGRVWGLGRRGQAVVHAIQTLTANGTGVVLQVSTGKTHEAHYQCIGVNSNAITQSAYH